MAILNFDATQVAPDEGRVGPVPAGWYIVMLSSSETKATSTGRGSFLFGTFTIVDGQFNGRKLFHRFNTQHDNEMTVKIGLGQLSALCHAVGVLYPRDSAELHNIALKVRVKIKAAEDNYEASNDITAFKNVNEQVTETPSVTTQPKAWNPPQAQAWSQQPAHNGAAHAPQAWQPPKQQVQQQPWQNPPQQPWQQQAPQQPQQVPNSGAPAQSAVNPTQEGVSPILMTGTTTTTSPSDSRPPWAR